MKAVALACLAAAVTFSVPSTASAQESKSAPLAKQLAAALDAAKLDSVAAKDPSSPDSFVAALYFPGLELLVVSAKYSAPSLLTDKILAKNYRDIYIDLNSASLLDTKVFIEDLGADGLQVKREENKPFDSYTAGVKHTMFDSEWKAQKLSEEDYKKTFATADEKYTAMLTALLGQLKKTS
jgi:hypothetical protein